LSKLKKTLADGPLADWGPWAAVSFPNRETRDRFVLSVASGFEAGWGAEPTLDDVRSAWVRWRPGRFLRLNDMAYAHGGRIVVAAAYRKS
jgi:hypothetical protein